MKLEMIISLLRNMFFLIIGLNKFSLTEIITVPFLRREDGQFRIHEKISQDYYFAKPSLLSPFSFLYTLRSKRNESIGEIPMKNSHLNETGLVFEKVMNLGNMDFDLKYFGSIQINKEDVRNSITENDHLSFALNPDDKEMSVMHQVYNKKLINRMIFSMGALGNKSFYMYLGGVPPVVSYAGRRGECDVIGNSWGCSLNEIFFEDVFENKKNKKILSYRLNNKIAVFSTDTRKIQVTSDYFNFLKESLFKEAFDKKLCKVYNNQRNILCENAKIIFDSLPSFITFVFDSVSLSIHKEHLVDDKEFVFELKDESNNNNNEWIFGIKFIQLFFMSFDYEQKKISFYLYTNGISKLNSYSPLINHLQISICFLLMIVMFSGLMILLGKIKNIELKN